MSNELSSYAVRKNFPARDEPAFSNRDIPDGAQHGHVRAPQQLQIAVRLIGLLEAFLLLEALFS